MTSLPPIPKKRGRPRKYERVEIGAEKPKPVELKDSEILEQILKRMDLLRRTVKGVATGQLRSLIASGKAGVGKTFTVEQVLEHLAANNPNFKYQIVRGYITPINLYMLLHDNAGENCVTVLDDTDDIFADDDGRNLLKAALDTTKRRIISWRSENAALSSGYDKEFEYKGTMIFITNIDFQAYLEAGKNRITPHLEALMTRTLYLDMKIHDRRSLSLWVDYMVTKQKMLEAYGLNEKQSAQVLKFLHARHEKLRTLSLREAVKCAQIMNLDPDGWEDMADGLLCR